MLILSRMLDEEIVLFDSISKNKTFLKIHAIEGKKAKVAISAPKAVCIDRKEIYDSKRNKIKIVNNEENINDHIKIK